MMDIKEDVERMERHLRPIYTCARERKMHAYVCVHSMCTLAPINVQECTVIKHMKLVGVHGDWFLIRALAVKRTCYSHNTQTATAADLFADMHVPALSSLQPGFYKKLKNGQSVVR